jgi:uncharacterized protein YyaL (SSP411 family)
LSRFLDKPDYVNRAERVFSLLADGLARHPQACSNLLLALDFHLTPPLDIVLAGDRNSEGIERFRAIQSRMFLPNRTLAFRASEENEEGTGVKRMPLLAGKKPLEGQPAAYVCHNRTCLSPIRSAEELRQILDRKTVDNRMKP